MYCTQKIIVASSVQVCLRCPVAPLPANTSQLYFLYIESSTYTLTLGWATSRNCFD